MHCNESLNFSVETANFKSYGTVYETHKNNWSCNEPTYPRGPTIAHTLPTPVRSVYPRWRRHDLTRRSHSKIGAANSPVVDIQTQIVYQAMPATVIFTSPYLSQQDKTVKICLYLIFIYRAGTSFARDSTWLACAELNTIEWRLHCKTVSAFLLDKNCARDAKR